MSFRYPKLGDAMTKPPKKGSNLRKSGVPAAGGRGDKKKTKTNAAFGGRKFFIYNPSGSCNKPDSLKKKASLWIGAAAAMAVFVRPSNNQLTANWNDA